jgi:hypothetical protein
MLEFFLYIAVLCANTATAYPTPLQIQPSQLQAHHVFLRHLNTTLSYSNNSTSNDTFLREPNIDRNPLTQARRENSNQHAWAYIIAKLVAGVAGLTALMIIVFWLHRRSVRARRRRLGVMMGLGVQWDEVLRRKWFATAGAKDGKHDEEIADERKRKRGSHVWKKSSVKEKGKGGMEGDEA